MQQLLSSRGHIPGASPLTKTAYSPLGVFHSMKTSKPCLGWKVAAACLSDLVHFFLERKSGPAFLPQISPLTSLFLSNNQLLSNNHVSRIQATSSMPTGGVFHVCAQ